MSFLASANQHLNRTCTQVGATEVQHGYIEVVLVWARAHIPHLCHRVWEPSCKMNFVSFNGRR